MLVLSRRPNQRVFITVGNERIIITVTDIEAGKHGKKVRLGFECDPAISVNREELQLRIDKESNTITGVPHETA